MNRPILFHVTLRRLIHMGRVVPDLDEKVKESINLGENPKELPTRRNITRVDLPVTLEFAAKQALKKHSSKKFRHDVLQAKSTIYKHKLPDDQYILSEKTEKIKTEIYLRKLREKHVHNADSEFVEDEPIARSQMEELIKNKLERRRRDWHYLEYDDYVSALYMAARLAPNYAAIKTVMDEIKSTDPEFKPRTVLDFGSGMGTTMWAINETWLNTTSEFLNVDISKSQHELAEYLLRGGRESGENIPGIFFKNYLPTSHLVKYDLVVSAFSLLDLPTVENRISVIENLWHKTNDLLVIIERGNKDGFTSVVDARHFILNISGHNVAKTLNAVGELAPKLGFNKPSCHIISPCPHEFVCPRLQMSSKGSSDTCNFSVNYEPLEIGMNRGTVTKENFSYIVLRKGCHPSYNTHDETKPRWPRVVEPRKKRSKHMIHKLCCPNGHLAETIITKRRYGSAMYKVAKSCDWGDILPVTVDDSYCKKSSELIEK